MRKLFTSTILAVGLLPTLTTAQGVPTVDATVIRQAIAKATALQRDLGVQRDALGLETSLADVQSAQLTTLEGMTGAMTGPGYDVSALEGGGAFGASSVYPVDPNTPMDARLFVKVGKLLNG